MAEHKYDMLKKTMSLPGNLGKSSISTEDAEKKTIMELKKLFAQTIQVDVAMQREIYKVEKVFEKQYHEIYDKRFKLLEDFKKMKCGDDATEHEELNNFWLKVLQASYTEFITKEDEKVLTHLIDIRSKLYIVEPIRFSIEFRFEQNEFFSNPVLTKTYFINCMPDKDDPLSFDGAEICKCEGCRIDWKGNPVVKNMRDSFFNFFAPPPLPENPEESDYGEINAVLQNDYELGFYLKERVIPKAVMFFTGEIEDCQSSEEESSGSEEYEETDTSEQEEGDGN